MTLSTPAEVSYCTAEHVQDALDNADAVRLNRLIAGACRAAARDVEGHLHRRFYPHTASVYLEPRRVAGDTLWVNDADTEILSLSALSVDGVTLTEGTDFFLELPGGNGPPYTAIRLIREAGRSWSTVQRGNLATGEFGGSAGSEPAGELAAAIASASVQTITVSDSSLVGVGDLLLVDTERILVWGKAYTTTTATVTGTVDAEESVTTIPVSSGSLVHAGERILVGSERMFVEDVVGNNLIVQRAQQASVLAAHAAADVVYAQRLVTVTRGAAGTTAASHLSGASLVRNLPPSLVVTASAALAINTLEQSKAGYTRTAGIGDNRRQTGGTGVAAAVAAALESAYDTYGRKGRIGVC